VNETNQIEALQSLAEVAKVRKQSGKRTYLATVRVSPGAYLAVSSVLTFVAALLLRSGSEGWALILVLLAWALVPALALTDRIAFDGEVLIRRGLIPFLRHFFSGKREQLSIADVERVDTNAVRTLRRGGRVRYRYRSQLFGKGTGFAFASGGPRYRDMVRQLFPVIVDNKLDLRTRDLRDYLCDPKRLSQEAKTLQLASPDVLDNATSDLKVGRRGEAAETRAEVTGAAVERAAHLRQLGNRLRIAGRLKEAREAFRRALIVLPHDAWLIFDFARLLRSQASAEADADLLARARAALRLSSMRADEDARLLALLGESLLEYNDVTRAERNFQRALELEPGTYRARLGLADVALRSGKLAHVINQYRDAAVATNEKALVAFANREADYYFSLNDDDDYLSSELRRINWLQTLSHMRRLAARITNASILIALLGPYLNSTIGGMGWALASSSLVAWLLGMFGTRLLAERRKRPTE
jgi:tetratricopeptide (TPR) repeat protein